jgi:hypothetical protein
MDKGQGWGCAFVHFLLFRLSTQRKISLNVAGTSLGVVNMISGIHLEQQEREK